MKRRALSTQSAIAAGSAASLIACGQELKAYPQDILVAAQAASTDLLNETAGKDANFKAIYDQWQTFRQQIRAWNAINELSYAQFVQG